MTSKHRIIIRVLKQQTFTHLGERETHKVASSRDSFPFFRAMSAAARLLNRIGSVTPSTS